MQGVGLDDRHLGRTHIPKLLFASHGPTPAIVWRAMLSTRSPARTEPRESI